MPEKIGLEEEAEAMASLNLTQFTFVLSSEITKELVTVLNLGMNTYLLAKARESDFFPPTDFQASMLRYAADLMEAVLVVEGRQRDAGKLEITTKCQLRRAELFRYWTKVTL